MSASALARTQHEHERNRRESGPHCPSLSRLVAAAKNRRAGWAQVNRPALPICPIERRAPMFQELLARFTQDAGNRPLVIALAVAGAGLFLWVIGARVSRSVYTLVGVTLGAWAGLQLPRWCGWEIDAMAPAIGGALVLGLAGYWLHTLWVGLTLGSLLASAGAFVAWHRLADHAAWATVPAAVDPSTSFAENLRHAWSAIPAAVPWQIPAAAIAGLIAGGSIALIWPKLGRVLAFTLLGTVMLVVGAVAAMALGRPQWLARIPESTQTRGIAMAILVVLGAAIQWALCPRGPKSLKAAEPGDVVSKWRAEVPHVRDVRDLGQTAQGPPVAPPPTSSSSKLLKEVR